MAAILSGGRWVKHMVGPQLWAVVAGHLNTIHLAYILTGQLEQLCGAEGHEGSGCCGNWPHLRGRIGNIGQCNRACYQHRTMMGIHILITSIIISPISFYDGNPYTDKITSIIISLISLYDGNPYTDKITSIIISLISFHDGNPYTDKITSMIISLISLYDGNPYTDKITSIIISLISFHDGNPYTDKITFIFISLISFHDGNPYTDKITSMIISPISEGSVVLYCWPLWCIYTGCDKQCHWHAT